MQKRVLRPHKSYMSLCKGSLLIVINQNVKCRICAAMLLHIKQKYFHKICTELFLEYLLPHTRFQYPALIDTPSSDSGLAVI